MQLCIPPTREFYLSVIRRAYVASRSGHSPAEIAYQLGLHVRTVRQYLRLSALPSAATDLITAHPKLFTATWALRMARRGPLPPAAVLHQHMQMMVTAGRTWMPPVRADDKTATPGASRRQQEIVARWRSQLQRAEAAALGPFLQRFVTDLAKSGFVTQRQRAAIHHALWDQPVTPETSEGSERPAGSQK